MPTLAGSYNVNSAGRDTTTLTTPSFTPTTGEILVLKGVTETSGFALGTPTASGGGITWTKRVENATGSNVYGVIWTGTVTSGGSAITVSIPGNASISGHSMTVERWSDAMLATTPVTVNVSGTGAPSTTITTTGTGSIVSYLDGDWAAVAGTAAYTNSATQDGIHQMATVYGAYYAYQTAATAGSQTFGMSTPTGQTWTLLAIEVQAPSAQVSLLGQTFNTTSGTHTVVATPAVNDLIVIIRANTGNVTSTAPTDGGGTYTKITSALKATSADLMEVWMRTALVTSAVSTTYSDAAGTTTGGGIAVYKITGMTNTGASAIRGSGAQANQPAASTPAPLLSSTPLSGNPVIGAVFNATSPATMTPRTGYTEDVDVGYATPTTGFESMHRNNGETSAAITWGATSSSAFSSVAIELAYNTLPNAPTLSSPVDTGTVSTATPQLQWSDTDPNNDSISYEAQIDTVNTFDSSPSAAVIDSYSEANVDDSQQMYAGSTVQGIGQSFTGTAGTLDSVKFYLRNNFTSPTGTITAKIYAHSGTFGTSSVPTGTALAVSDVVNATAITSNYSLTKFSFSSTNRITLSAATKYVVTVEYNGGSSTNHIDPGYDASSPTAAGNLILYNGTSWTADSTKDLAFYVYIAATGPLLDKFSNTDTGFTDITNGAHTDPFTSGETIGYTTTSLSNGTYYWRVRGKDPTGTNTYGSWSGTRSFTVSVAGSTPTNQFFLFF